MVLILVQKPLQGLKFRLFSFSGAELSRAPQVFLDCSGVDLSFSIIDYYYASVLVSNSYVVLSSRAKA